MERSTDKKALAGRKVLTAHLEDGACGWFVGSVFTSSVGSVGVSYKKGKKGTFGYFGYN